MAVISYGRTNTTSMAQGAIDVIEDALSRHEAWAKVATITSATSQPCSVWRCSGNRTALRRDWYLLIARPSALAPTSLSIAVAEGLDTNMREVIRPVPGTGATSVIPAEDGSYGGGISFPVWTDSTLNAVDIRWMTVSVGNSNTYDVWVVATNDSLTLTYSTANTSGSGTVVHAGIGEPFREDDPGIVALASSQSVGGVTRHPTVVTVNSTNWIIENLGSANCIWTKTSGSLGAQGDRLHDSRPVGSRVLVRHTGPTQTTGTLRGLLRHVLHIPTTREIYRPGEKVFVGADQYHYPGDNSADLWVNTAPA